MPHCRWTRWLSRCLVSVWMLGASVSAAAEDPYLAGLQAESEKLGSLDRAKKEQGMLERPTPATKAKPIPHASTDIKQVQFETELSQQYPAGYALYQKLNAKDQGLIFHEYAKAPMTRRHAAAIRKTIELSIGK